MQEGKKTLKLSDVKLDLPEAEGVPLEELQLQQPPFELHFHHLDFQDTVKEFRGVIGQDGALIHIGDFVKLSFPYNEVSSLKNW